MTAHLAQLHCSGWGVCLTPRQWYVAMLWDHAHYARCLWGEVWDKLTSDPTNTYNLLVRIGIQ